MGGALADAFAFTRFLIRWHGLHESKANIESLPSVVKKLQGYPIPYSDLEKFVLPSRIESYQYGELDDLCKKHVIGWQGIDRISQSDGYVAIYFKEMIPELARISALNPAEMCNKLRSILAQAPLEFEALKTQVGGFPPQLLTSLWEMVWSGEVSNRRLLPLQSLRAHAVKQRQSRSYQRARYRTGQRHIDTLPGSGASGAWYLIASPTEGFADPATREAALVTQLLIRWGVVTREVFEAEGALGGALGGLARYLSFLRELTASGKLVEGDFVDGLSSPQFALAPATELLTRESERKTWESDFVVLAATDPANPFGAIFPWPPASSVEGRPKRTAGARAIIYNGYLIGYLSRDGHDLRTYLSQPGLTKQPGDRLIHAICSLVGPSQPILLKTIDGCHPSRCPFEPNLRAIGFTASQNGYIYRG